MINHNLCKGIYAISDGSSQPFLTSKIEQVIEGGVSIIQYRDKSSDQNKRYEEALAIKKLCDQHNIPLLINDDVQLAKEIAASGVHLGSSDASLLSARASLGSKAIIGISCYNQLNLAINAEKQGADYVAFGSMFPSLTKPDAPKASIDLIIKARKELNIPICCIGGITDQNMSELVTAGADMIALISAIFSDNSPKKAAQRFSNSFWN